MTSIRDALLASRPDPLSCLVDVGGQRVLVRQPTVAQRDRIQASATVDGHCSPGRLAVYAALECTVDPETGARVFQDVDAVQLLGLPTGSFVEVLGVKALELIREAEEKGKASRETDAVGSCSPSPKS